MEALPLTVEELIDRLDEQFPLRNPNPSSALPNIMYQAGQRSVVEYLRGIQASDEE